MNRICIIICIISCMQQTISSMELKGTELQITFDTAPSSDYFLDDELIEKVDTEIKKNFADIIYIFGTCRFNFTPDKMLSVINIAAECTNDLIDRLYNQNICFENAIDYFCEKAEKNLEQLNADNLTIISDPAAKQPVVELNTLPPHIKKYCMNRVLENIHHTIDVPLFKLTNQEKNGVIHGNAHLTLIINEDGTMDLWSLARAQLIHTFTKKRTQSNAFFNDAGSRLAIATLSGNNPQKMRVKIWDVLTKKYLHKIRHTELVDYIQFAEKKSDTTLLVFGKKKLSLYALQEDKKPRLLGETQAPRSIDFKPKNNNYPKLRREDGMLIAKKINCHALYLCQTAVDKAVKKYDLNIIEQKLPQLPLTDYEKKIATKKITDKRASLL